MNKKICNLANLLWPHRLTNRLSAFDSSAHNNNAVSFLKKSYGPAKKVLCNWPAGIIFT